MSAGRRGNIPVTERAHRDGRDPTPNDVDRTQLGLAIVPPPTARV